MEDSVVHAEPARSHLGGAVAIGLCTAVELFVLATRGRFDLMMTEFEIDYPLVTELATGWELPALLAVLIVLAILKEFVPAPGRVINVCNGLIALSGIGCFVVYLVGIALPLFKVIQALS